MTEESDDSDSDKIITHKLLWRSDCEKHGSHIRVYTLPIPVCMLRFHTRFPNFHSHFACTNIKRQWLMVLRVTSLYVSKSIFHDTLVHTSPHFQHNS